MAKANVIVPAPADLEVQQERTNFKYLLAKNPNYFGNIPGSKLKADFKLIADTGFEQLNCVGYNPDTRNMEAIFSIKRSSGYAGDLCSPGSFEYVRFYLDFHDGLGFIDQGVVAVNVHDIPASTDCKGKSIFPISYAATLPKKTSKWSFCNSPVLPTLRAILSWNHEPPAASPGWTPVWGNVLECDVQLKPTLIFLPEVISPLLTSYLSVATAAPHLTVAQAAEISGVDLAALSAPAPSPSLADHVEKSVKLKVPASRFAFKTVANMMKYPTSELTLQHKEVLSAAKVDFTKLIDDILVPLPIDTSKANVDFEELECVGLDYNTESLVATIRIKKKNGYSGDLCDAGSKEYIAFWINWNSPCNWEYLNTMELRVHDIKMTGDHLCYSVVLPLDARYHRKLCSTPNVVQVRAVLSWNIPPSTTNPNKLEYYGNRVDAHVQIKPGPVIVPGDVFPLFNIIGGIDVAHVNDASGLTKPGSFFAYNGLSVPTGAPFGGLIVLNGPTFPGYRYKIRITNLNTGISTYATNTFTVVGHLSVFPYVQYTNQAVDGDGYYHFLDPEKNTLNVLARFTPGTNDKFLVEMEVDTVPGSFSKTIQMDNTWPEISLSVDDGGDCTKYKKGDTITGHYYVNDLYIQSWSFGSTWGGGASGTGNTPAMPGTPFSIATGAASYPCGAVSLYAVDKAIVDSQSVGHERYASYNICLREK